jgi:oxygen-dependent protoporphyrinogen oxidase
VSEAVQGPEAGPQRRVVVVGAGIAGLSAALRLAGSGCRVTVLESADRVGGKLLPGEVGGVPVDFGAEAMIARRPEGVALARAAGLAEDLEPPATTRSALWSRGGLHPMPTGHLMGVPGDPGGLAGSGLISARGLERAAVEPELPAPPVAEDVSVGGYVAARLGREVVDRLVEPLLGGVYAGSADRISLQAAIPQLYAIAREGGSLTEGVRRIQEAARDRLPDGAAPAPVFTGLRGGVGRLPAAVAETCRAAGVGIRTGSTVTGMKPDAAGGWTITSEDGDGPRQETADAVVLAVPATAAAVLLHRHTPSAALELGTVEYADMALVTMALPRAALADTAVAGSGFLVPPVDGRTIKAATFASSKWGWIDRADPETFVLRTSVGRHGEERDLAREDAELVALARRDLREAVGLAAEPIEVKVTRWHAGLPQYPVGHVEKVARVRRVLRESQQVVAVCGAAYDGVGIPACIGSGERAAEQVAEILGRTAVPVGRESGRESGRE